MLRILEADITTLQVDVIVNASNCFLRGGGGVDGAIHRAAGPSLQKACADLPFADEQPGIRCPTGDVRITPAFDLPSRFIVHTVGPVFECSSPERARSLLTSCYRNVLTLASLHGSSVAIPAISTGIYGFPAPAACLIAYKVCSEWKDRLDITLVTYRSPEVTEAFREICPDLM